MTREEMAAIVPHADWDDGRYNALWCRFDAIVSRDLKLRAEITWNDDSESSDVGIIEPTRYYEPMLFLELNEIDDAESAHPSWRTVDGVSFSITDAEAKRLAESPSSLILDLYVKPLFLKALEEKFASAKSAAIN